MKRFTSKIGFVCGGMLIAFVLVAALNCTNSQQAQDQAALTSANATSAKDQAQISVLQGMPPTTQQSQLIAAYQLDLQEAQNVQAKATAALAALQAQQNGSFIGQVSTGLNTAGGALPAPWNGIALALGVIAAAIAGTQTYKKSQTESDLADAQAALANHQTALAALSGSTVPLTTVTTLSHPALDQSGAIAASAQPINLNPTVAKS